MGPKSHRPVTREEAVTALSKALQGDDTQFTDVVRRLGNTSLQEFTDVLIGAVRDPQIIHLFTRQALDQPDVLHTYLSSIENVARQEAQAIMEYALLISKVIGDDDTLRLVTSLRTVAAERSTTGQEYSGELFDSLLNTVASLCVRYADEALVSRPADMNGFVKEAVDIFELYDNAAEALHLVGRAMVSWTDNYDTLQKLFKKLREPEVVAQIIADVNGNVRYDKTKVELVYSAVQKSAEANGW
jgi:hypothetical protein